MKSLSIRQPWALLVCVGAKLVENRTWKTSHRGEVAIHAGGYKDAVKHFREQDTRSHALGDVISFGAIIGTVELHDSLAYVDNVWEDPFAEGPFCLLFRNAKLFREPISHSGRVNLCELPTEVAKQVEDAKADCIDVTSELREQCLAAVPAGPVPKQFLRAEPKWYSPGG